MKERDIHIYLIARSSKFFSKDITACFEKIAFKIEPLEGLRISLGDTTSWTTCTLLRTPDVGRTVLCTAVFMAARPEGE